MKPKKLKPQQEEILVEVRATQLIAALEKMVAKHGDLAVVCEDDTNDWIEVGLPWIGEDGGVHVFVV